MSESRTAEVAVVGGGPAGAALAIRLADSGHETVLFERHAAPAWRASGVFSSPLTRARLADLGLLPDEMAGLIRPIDTLELRSTGGAQCRFDYEPPFACGLDRVRLDATLLERARASGARVLTSAVVTNVELPTLSGTPVRLDVSATDPSMTDAGTWTARLVIGADGPRSVVARAAGVDRPTAFLRRAGITYHLSDAAAAGAGQPMSGRFLFGAGWYAGIAPVPGGRVNVGIVVAESMLRAASGPGTVDGVERLAAGLLADFPEPHDAWQSGARTDQVAVALPLAHRVSRVAGPGFVLVGDACGFVDPLSGDGIHRALVSSHAAARAAVRLLNGDASAAADYDRHLRARLRNKDLVSWLLQLFLARPELLNYGLRRLGRRPAQRNTLRRVLTDELPASRVLDPRFLVGLLRP